MSSLSWLASTILIIVTIVLAALWLRRRAQVPLGTLAVAAGFSLLGLGVERLAIAMIHRVGIRRGPAVRRDRRARHHRGLCGDRLLFELPRCPVDARQPHQLVLRRTHEVSRPSGSVVMAGLGYGAMSIPREPITGSDSLADGKPVAK